MTTDAFELVAGALSQTDGRAYFVGGSVRDQLLGLPTTDVDLIVEDDPRESARAVHRSTGGDIFSLSDRFGTWRVLTPHGFQVDITELRGADLGEDLAARDFTVNAMARSVSGGEVVDPFQGAADLESKTLRMVSEQAFVDDPLRLVRLARFAVTLGLEIEPATLAAAQRNAGLAKRPAAERVFAELRAIVGSRDPVRGIELLDQVGLLDVLLPELANLKGVEQTVYHHKDVYGHTLEVLERTVELENSGYEVFGDHAAALRELLAEDLADELTLAGGIRWAALLHDIGKPDTLTRFDEDRVGFPGHDIRGAEIVREICRRLHTSERFSQYVAALTRHHMRLGFQIPKRPLSKRDIYSYFVKSRPVEVEVGVLSVADRMSTRGRKHEEGIPRHIEFAIEMTDLALDWRANPLEPLIRGDELAKAVGIAPGPKLGELLAEIAEAQYAGEVTTADEAIALAQKSL